MHAEQELIDIRQRTRELAGYRDRYVAILLIPIFLIIRWKHYPNG